MKLIINGAGGRMGKALRAVIEKRENDTIVAAIDPFVKEEGMLSCLENFAGDADCILDFSNHAGTQALCAYAVAKKLPVVVATTGHTQQELEMIQKAARSVPVFWSGNMSVGIALLAKLAKQTAAMFPDADIEIVESHHNQKLDVPSGTALMLARAVREARPEAEFLVGRHENGKRQKKEVGIHSLRMGNTVGIHEVIVNTGTQIITLKHEAQDRALFAEGALTAAAFLVKQAPGLYTMEEMLHD
jgi:4-hydroxy-tetrahydrodipicolinate reductase